ncbi:MAG: PKD domain-containing protein [Bacteroidia bacterium]|nr:PKD domain-containing protein [Bacteroidia bacterium]
MGKLRFIFSFFVFLIFKGVFAQTDTSFWFVAPNTPTVLPQSPIGLQLQTFTSSATIRIRQPANPAGVDLTVNLAANTTTFVDLTSFSSAVLSAPSNTISNKGLYISSTSKITAHYVLNASSARMMCSLKGSRGKGLDFYVPFPNNITAMTHGTSTVECMGFHIVATENNTSILITPKAAMVGRAKNVTFLIVLQRGQTFSLLDNNAVNPSELAGSIVSADKPVAVTVSGATGNSTVCPSVFADQIVNSSQIGKEYVIFKGNGTSDYFYILSPVNGNSLTINSGTVTNWLINSFETYSVNSTTVNLSFVQCSKPAYLMHVSNFGCKTEMSEVTPAYCAGSYSTAFSRFSADSFFLNIYTRAGFQNQFSLTVNGNNVPVSPASFTVVPGSSGNLVGARLFYNTSTIPVGAYCRLINTGDVFGASISNGNTPGGAQYAHLTDFGTSPFVFANSVPTATICSNTNFTLNGVIGGGPISGFWTTNGYGTFSSGSLALTNNIYIPSPLDTNIKPVNIILTSTGFCPNKSDTLKLFVKQAPIVSAGVNQTKCTNNPTVQLNGQVIGGSTVGVWSALPPASGTFQNINSLSTAYFPSSTDTSLNSIIIVLTSTNNGICNAVTSSLTITFQKAPLVKASSTPTITRCTNNATVNLNGYISNGITNGIWTTSGSGIFVPNNISLVNNYIPSGSDLINFPIKLKLTTPPHPLCKPVSDSVYVLFINPPTISAGPDLNACKNNAVVNLSATVGGTITSSVVWSGGSGTFLPSNTVLNPTYVATPSETNAGFVYLTVTTTSNGICNAVNDQIRIDFQDAPQANFSAPNVCLGAVTNFSNLSVQVGSGIITQFNWNFGDGNTSSITNPSHTYSLAGSYPTKLVIANNYGCRDSIVRTVTVYPLPEVKFGITRSCNGNFLNFCFKDSTNISPPSFIPPTGYYWDFGGNNPGFSFAKDTCIGFITHGIFTISHTVTSNHGCVGSLSKTINVTPPPKAKFYFYTTAGNTLNAQYYFVDSSKNAISWFWNFGNGYTSTLQNPTTFYNQNGTYTVSQTVYDQFGCSHTYTLIIRINNIVEELTKFIPNIISPNGDGKNDYWRLDFINAYYPDAEIEIFNRWGESIFKSKGYANAWDGSYRGDPLPVGVYFFTIDLKDPRFPEVIKGTVTLVK